MRSTPVAAAVAAAFLWTSANVLAQPGTTTTSSATANAPAVTAPADAKSAPRPIADAPKLAHHDRKFLEHAAEGGMKEVELGKLAANQANDPAVKQFGERMVKDHTDANKKVMDMAQSKGVTVPSAISKGDQRDIDKLAKRQGADFDKHYMDMMVKEHKKDVKAFEKEAKSKDADLAQLASSTLPTLQEHLKLAQSAQQTAKAEKKMASQ